MTKIINMCQHAQDIIERFSGSSLPQVVKFLENLRHHIDPVYSTLPESVQEKSLLDIIQRKLPAKDQTRLAYLRQQNESRAITEPEHQELLEHVEQIEQQDAERAESFIKLAQLRNVDLKILMNEYLVPQAV
jgi:translation initiation factor 2B subunit (eIF-2B alpha/beta/delta family)